LNVAIFALVVLSFLAHRQGMWHAPKPLAPALVPLPDDQVLKRLDQLNTQTAYITERPLFWPSRKPLPAQAPVDGLGSLEGAQLLGTFADGTTRGAIIRIDKKTGKVIRLVAGEAYQGLTLMQVEPFSVAFADPSGHIYHMKLEYAKQEASTTLPTATRLPNQPTP